MALTNGSLTDIGFGPGFTTNFQVQYEATLPNVAAAIANADALLGVLENEFNVTTSWFATPAGKFGTGNRQVVDLNLNATATSFPGANNSGYGNPINCDAQNGVGVGASIAAGRTEMVFMNEWVEVLMGVAGNWNAGDSNGEGLSQYCGIVRFQAGHYNYYTSWVDQWLNQSPRPDWVNQTFTGNSTTRGDADPISFGCALCFIYYLNVQLGFTINQIIAAHGSTMADTYQKLTGDSGDPFPFFAALMEKNFPTGTPATIPGPVTDNPFPLGLLQFWANKPTFGKDEVKDLLKTKGGVWTNAFWLIVDGFSKNSFNSLGVTASTLTGAFANLAGVTITQNSGGIIFQNAANPASPQMIRIPYDVHFTQAAADSDFPATGNQMYDLNAFLTIGGTKVPGSDAAIEFELVAGADPYFSNINTNPGDPTANNDFYLSQDLRVFTAIPGLINRPVLGGPSFSSDSVAGAYSYVQSLLTFLNDSSNHFTDGTRDPFSDGTIPQQDGALENFSSVAPETVQIFGSPFPGPLTVNTYKNYPFAIARVRLQGTAGPSGAADGVKVFFRIWSTETVDADYQPGSTYPFLPDGAGLPGSPLVGSDHITLPMFASGNLNANSDYAPGGPNTRNMVIPTAPPGEDLVWAYYGCFLNIFDSGNVIDGKSIQEWLNGTHHCLVAQIAYDQAPILIGATPSGSDKLAQRNLQLTLVDNPGPASAHRVPQTFDIRPSTGGIHLAEPDELMIDWGAVPVGSVASIYWPQVMASTVIGLASSIYSSHSLTAADTHTIQTKITGGVTYVPIPSGTGENFAGLITLDVPMVVKKGQEFNVVIRRISTREINPPVVINVRTHSLPSTVEKNGKAGQVVKSAAVAHDTSNPPPVSKKTYRYVVGTFTIKIPVTTGEVMLRPEENTLAIMKWRLEKMAPANRWYPVLQRYISYIAGRVDGLGGNSSSIPPNVNGVPVKKQLQEPEHRHEFKGKVCEIIYNCFGDFEGFVLSECCSGSRTFKTCERGFEAVVLRACRERLLLSVFVEGKPQERICELVVRCS
ncbi:hypothetical protein HDF16_004131 [Granulicella aggregans]|uniref:Uncharacterized protein n=1 Tax=Granulicella aggregans TaxID=474949 RepID=A0A7W8E6M5_9BACT|nr:hypothetical protein [Granulicella aggregans]MBB5059405.1 hypothetical protein [Granulicella aggregans]